MAKRCKITVYYTDGRVDEFYGGLHLSNTVLKIWPPHGASVTIPLINILKYETSD